MLKRIIIISILVIVGITSLIINQNSGITVKTKVTSIERHFDEHGNYHLMVQTEYSTNPKGIKAWVNIGDTILISEYTITTYISFIIMVVSWLAVSVLLGIYTQQYMHEV